MIILKPHSEYLESYNIAKDHIAMYSLYIIWLLKWINGLYSARL